MKPSRLLAALLLSAQAWSGHAGWPELPFPDGARVESLGEQVRLNGVPMRMYRVFHRQSAGEVAAYYRAALGPELADGSLLGDRLLSQGRGDHFITIRIRPLSGSDALALVSISDVRAARRAAGQAPGIRLPAGSTILSDLESVDAGRSSRHLVVTNRSGMQANLRLLDEELARLGYKPDPAPARGGADSLVRLYGGDRREARLVLVREDGVTHVVLTTIRDR